jgi:vanillate O-demethylase monooxygenase subunit
LHNAWYAASWNHELGEGPLAMTLLEQPVVLFRDSGGKIRALEDRCPHRFAPLSRGRVNGDVIVCGYHGLEFGGDGHCVRNPHGKGVIPNALQVRTYPVAVHCGMIWVWMGQAARADRALLPAFPDLESDRFAWVYGQLDVAANYELVIDNLLDLTHVEFLHPFLASPGNSERTRFRAEQHGDMVSAYYDVQQEPITGLFRLLWEGKEETANLVAYMHWQAPTNLMLDNAMSTNEVVGDDDPHVQVIHLLTPVSENLTRYFWAAGRNRELDNAQISEMLHFGTQGAFENEDEPMIQAVRSRMNSNDLFAHKPALIPTDEAGVRARRILARLIAEERAEEA